MSAGILWFNKQVLSDEIKGSYSVNDIFGWKRSHSDKEIGSRSWRIFLFFKFLPSFWFLLVTFSKLLLFWRKNWQFFSPTSTTLVKYLFNQLKTFTWILISTDSQFLFYSSIASMWNRVRSCSLFWKKKSSMLITSISLNMNIQYKF